MPVRKIIHCASDYELPALHRTPDGVDTTLAYAINLGFEVQGSAFTPQEKDDARAAYADFFKNLKDLRFFLAAAPGSPVPAHPASVTPIAAAQKLSEPLLDPARLLAWLHESPNRNEPTFWLTKGAALLPDNTVAEADIGATHELRSVHAWNAPVGHLFGLTHVLKGLPLPEDDAVLLNQHYFIFPWFLAADPKPADLGIIDHGNNVIELTHAVGLGNGNAISTSWLRAEKQPERVRDDGFLGKREQTDDMRAMTRLIEERAASMTNANLAIAGTFSGTATPKALTDLFLATWGASAAPQLDAPNCAWRAVAALSIALDPMLVELRAPEQTGMEGLTLSVLVKAIRDKTATFAALRTEAQILAGIRKHLAASPLLSKSGSPAAVDRAAYVRALKRVHGLVVKVDGDPGDIVVGVLLDCYASATWPSAPCEINTAIETVIRKEDARDGVARGKKAKEGFARPESVSLLTFDTRLHEEAGFEDALLRFFTTPLENPATPGEYPAPDGPEVPKALAAAIWPDPGEADAALVHVTGAWTIFREYLLGPFNGAEAARRGAGTNCLYALMAAPPGGKPPATPGVVVARLSGSAYFARRVGLPVAGPTDCFDKTIAALPRPVLPATLSASPAFQGVFTSSFQTALEPVRALTQTGRFIPDATPRPLAIPVADSLVPAEVETFATHFNGIGVCLMRKDGDASAYASLDLAELSWPDVPKPPPLAIHPFLPAVTDGRGPMFLEYEGVPFAEALFETIIPHAKPEDDPPRRKPFYKHEIATKDVTLSPNLAYGRAFRVFSYSVSNAGTLPKSLRASDALPWRPRTKIAETPASAPPDEAVWDVFYQRRTAIGRTAILDAPGRAAPRIGVTLAGVLPLARDYPRRVLAAGAEAPGVCDLMRFSNGDAALALPDKLGSAGAAAVWLRNLSWRGAAGAKGNLVVELYTEHGDLTEPAAVSIRVDDIQNAVADGEPLKILKIIVEQDAGAGLSFKLSCTLDGAPAGTTKQFTTSKPRAWLRLRLEKTAAASACLSFDEPEAPPGASNAARDAALLLMAPEKKGWRDELSKSFIGKIKAPRVGYLDFERWFANKALRAASFAGVPANKVGTLFDALLAAYFVRKHDQTVARNINNLPDPAVSGLLVTVAVADATAPVAGEATRSLLIDFAGKLGTIAGGIAGNKFDSNWLKQNLLGDPRSAGADKNDVNQFEVVFDHDLVIKTGSPLNVDRTGKAVTITIPEGVVAHISVAPVVDKKLVGKEANENPPKAFDYRMRQFVAAETGAGSLVFPGADLLVETLNHDLLYSSGSVPNRDAAYDLVTKQIEVVSVEAARRYDLRTREGAKLDAAERARWRLISDVDVTTQRWRATGRPIYHMLDPRACRAVNRAPGDPPTRPALEVTSAGNHFKQVAEFEHEAFFDRIDGDAQTVSHRLGPLPGITVVQTIGWEAPSATYWRHRFTLRSRYAGALKDPALGNVQAWKPLPRSPGIEDVASQWTRRVAMLADSARVTITRPQVRALMPLTNTPAVEVGTGGAQPVMAYLQESPYARGGLADRVAAELALDFGYGFIDDNKPVQILDSRKQFGLDPRLTYFPMGAEDAYGLAMRVEGPAGLTYDRPGSPAPSFPNAALLARPENVAGGKVVDEEYFAGVSFRRYLDPAWTTGDAVDPGWQPVTRARRTAIAVDPERGWWIEIVEPKVGEMKIGFGALDALIEIGSIDRTDRFAIKVAKIVLDPVKPNGVPYVEIAHFARASIGRVALMHQPIADGRHSCAIFGFANDTDIAAGRASMPIMLAGFEWSPREEAGKPLAPAPGPRFTFPDAVDIKATPAVASAPTFLAWVRAGRNNDRGRCFNLVGATESEPTHLEEAMFDYRNVEARVRKDKQGRLMLSIARKGSADISSLWLCGASFAERRFPLHVHRHLALLGSDFATGPGRPLEICGNDITLLDGRAVWIKERVHDRYRVIEYETPAMILTDSNSAAPDVFKSAYFDLASNGYLDAPGESVLDINIRFAGNFEHLRKFTSLVVTISKPRADRLSKLSELLVHEHGFGQASGDCPLGLRVRLKINRPYNGDPPTMAAAFNVLSSTGYWAELDPVPAPTLTTPPPFIELPGFVLSIKPKGGPEGAEFWADVSVLHYTPGGAFWDWIVPRREDAGPERSVQPRALGEMTEAQARIIAVSPPINVRNM